MMLDDGTPGLVKKNKRCMCTLKDAIGDLVSFEVV